MSLLHAYAQRCFSDGPSTRSAVLAKGHVSALAVDLRGRCDEDELLLLVRVLQDDFGAVHVGFDRVHRLLDDQLHADRRGKMEHDVAPVDHLGEQRLVRHRVDDVREPRARLEVRDVVDRAGREVVDDGHLVAEVEQPFRQMRPDESGAARDERLHAERPRPTQLSGRPVDAASRGRYCRRRVRGRSRSVRARPSRSGVTGRQPSVRSISDESA